MTPTERRLRRLRWVAAVIVIVGAIATIALEVAAGRLDEVVFSAFFL